MAKKPIPPPTSTIEAREVADGVTLKPPVGQKPPPPAPPPREAEE